MYIYIAIYTAVEKFPDHAFT